MTEKNIEQKTEIDGRSIKINTGFYNIQVWGDPEDSIKDVKQLADDVADRAREDVIKIDEEISSLAGVDVN